MAHLRSSAHNNNLDNDVILLLIYMLTWFFTAVCAQTRDHTSGGLTRETSLNWRIKLLRSSSGLQHTCHGDGISLAFSLKLMDSFSACTELSPIYLRKLAKSFLWNGPKTNFGCALVPICRPTINNGAASACSFLIGNKRLKSVLWDIWRRRKETCERWGNRPKYADE